MKRCQVRVKQTGETNLSLVTINVSVLLRFLSQLFAKVPHACLQLTSDVKTGSTEGVWDNTWFTRDHQ